MTLHPELLRACAAYLLSPVYGIEDAMPLLRATAMPLARRYDHNRDTVIMPTTASADALSLAHLQAIGQMVVETLHSEADIARAIRDATPGMMQWWCERLAREE